MPSFHFDFDSGVRLVSGNPEVFHSEFECFPFIYRHVARGERAQLEGVATTGEKEGHRGVVGEPYGANALLVGAYHLVGYTSIEEVAYELLIAGNGAIGIGEITSIPTAAAIAEAYYARDNTDRYALPICGTPYSQK